jgi:hypothetical protein
VSDSDFSKPSPDAERDEYRQHAAHVVEAQLLAEPSPGVVGIPVDPDVAEAMGAFEEKALAPDDIDDGGPDNG